MKPQINKENRARFNAQYLWQDVIRPSFVDRRDFIELDQLKLNDELRLSLRSISDITDEEAIMIASIHFNMPESELTILGHGLVRDLFADESPGVNHYYGDMIHGLTRTETSKDQYVLLQQGFCLPFTCIQDGEVITFSVEDLVQMGLVELVGKEGKI